MYFENLCPLGLVETLVVHVVNRVTRPSVPALDVMSSRPLQVLQSLELGTVVAAQVPGQAAGCPQGFQRSHDRYRTRSNQRMEERRGGKGWESTCRSRG